jgi:hypothetical protein
MMRIFRELGSSIEEAWLKKSYDELAFPAIAAAALRKRRVHEAIDHEDVLRWLLTTRELPQQDDLIAAFGDPPVTVFRAPRFFIQVIFWLEGSTIIHRHAFSGAFMVLEGSSLHTRYTFAPRGRVTEHLLYGDLALRDASLIYPGDPQPITHDLIHGLFHLEAPSASIVVRTNREDAMGPQYSYGPPGLAIDPFFREEPMTRRLQALRFARRANNPRYTELCCELIATSDAHTAYSVLRQSFFGPGDPRRNDPLVAAAKKRHGAALAGELLATIMEELRDAKLERMGQAEKDADRRFFLALLRNLPDRDSIYAIITARYRDKSPRARVLRWAREVSGTDAIGVDLADDLNRALFEGLLDGLEGDALLARLGKEFDPKEVRAKSAVLLRHADRIRGTALSPLFRVTRAGSAGPGPGLAQRARLGRGAARGPIVIRKPSRRSASASGRA